MRPWQNVPLQSADMGRGYRLEAPSPDHAGREALTVVVIFSGGGARAAAFGYGVLKELERQRFGWRGQNISMLDEIDLIGGVSGGSIAAAYYAAFGKDAFLRDFKANFLHRDFQRGLVARTLRPATLQRLSSPFLGRGHVLMDPFDELFRGLTYGDLEKKGARPYLLITATDLSAGAPFEFTQEQFDLICSDLASVPLSFALASSSAVPLLLTPLALTNHTGRCPVKLDAQRRYAETDFRSRLLAARAAGYRDPENRPFIHLVDGGFADNLGIRQLREHELARGSDAPDESLLGIRKLVIVTVLAERSPAGRIDRSDAVPGTLDVADALVHGNGSARTTETLEILRDSIDQWRAELTASPTDRRADPGSPSLRAEDVYFIPVSPKDLDNAEEREAFRAIPTSFSISRPDLERVLKAARSALRNVGEFRRLSRDLGAFEGGPADCCAQRLSSHSSNNDQKARK